MLVNIGTGNGLVRQQAVTWANVDPDLCRHIVSQGYINIDGYVITCPVKCEMKLLNHSQTPMAAVLKFGNGLVISSHAL